MFLSAALLTVSLNLVFALKSQHSSLWRRSWPQRLAVDVNATNEKWDDSWVGNKASLSEEGYQLVASMKSHEDMKYFAKRILANVSLKVFDEVMLSGFLHHYNRTTAVQTLARMREELLRAPWVGPLQANDTTLVNGTGESHNTTVMDRSVLTRDASAQVAMSHPSWWPQYLAPFRGFCSSGWLQGQRYSSREECQNTCHKNQDCMFYCHSVEAAPEWSCLQYKACPTLKSTRVGTNMSMFSCYRKPPADEKASQEASPSSSFPVEARAPPEKIEHKEADAVFAALDKDHDGRLSKEEFRGWDNLDVASNRTFASTAGEESSDLKCGVLWFYHIPKCAGTSMGQWLQDMVDRGQLDGVINLRGEGEGDWVDNEAYRQLHKDKLEPFLKNPKGRFLAVHHHDWGPAMGGWMNKTLTGMKLRLQAQGCDLVRATVLRRPEDRTISSLFSRAGNNSVPWVDRFEGVGQLNEWFMMRMRSDKTLDNGMVRYLINNNKRSEDATNATEREVFPMALGAVNGTALQKAINILQTFEFVGFVEDLPVEVLRLANMLGITHPPPLQKLNANAVKAYKLMNEDVRRLISLRIKTDRLLYEAAKSHWSTEQHVEATAEEV